ncbi:MAG: hypothetical protein AABY64_08935 [Bdellovibrionota bacterium]
MKEYLNKNKNKNHLLRRFFSFIAYWSLNLLRLLFISPELRIRNGPDEFESFEERYHELKVKMGPSAWLK